MSTGKRRVCEYSVVMPLYGLSITSFLGALASVVYTAREGGLDAEVVLGDRVLTGTALYGIAALMFLAAALFFFAAVMRTIRRTASLIATLLLAGGAGIGGFTPDNVSDYAREHGCSSELAQHNSTTQKMCAERAPR